jgi:hypothetical protein
MPQAYSHPGMGVVCEALTMLGYVSTLYQTSMKHSSRCYCTQSTRHDQPPALQTPCVSTHTHTHTRVRTRVVGVRAVRHMPCCCVDTHKHSRTCACACGMLLCVHDADTQDLRDGRA